MSDLSQDAAQLASTHDIPELLTRAADLGLGHVLEKPLEVLFEVDGLSDEAAELLDDMSAVSMFPTIRDLEKHKQCAKVLLGAKPSVHRALHQALARWLAGQAPRPSNVTPAKGNIEAWAKEHHVTSWLAEPLRVLQDGLAWEDRRYLYLPGKTLRDLFTGGIQAPGTALERLQKVARRLLGEKAAEAKTALDEERARLGRPPPEEPTARALHGRALVARAWVRDDVAPRPGSATAKLETDPPTLVVVEETWPHQNRVMIPLQPAAGASLAASCSCREGVARCVHALRAYDLLLDVLTEPEHVGTRSTLVAELARPAWLRALGDLDRQLVAPAPPASTRVVWRLDCEDGRIDLFALLQKQRKGGAFSSGSRSTMTDLHRTLPSLPTMADRKAVKLLYLAERLGPAGDSFPARALLALVGHPHVTLAVPPHPPLAVRLGELSLGLIDGEDGAVTVTPLVDGEPVAPQALACSQDGIDDVAWLFDEERLTCTVMRAPPDVMTVVGILARRGGGFPAEAVPSLMERLPVLAGRMAVSLPPSLRGDEVPADERPLLRLEPRTGGALRMTLLARPVAGGPAHPPGKGPAEVVSWRQGRRVHARRALAREEERARAALATLPLRPEAEVAPFEWLLDRREEPLDVLHAIAQAQERFVVEWLGEPRAVTRTAAAADLRVRIDDRRDWFGLSGELLVDGAALPLPQLLAAIRERRRYVEVKGGLWVRIGDELRARLEPASDHLEHGRPGDVLEISPMAAPALAELAGAADDAPRRLHELLARMKRAGDQVAEPPVELAPVLRDYQLAGFRWLARLASWATGACLADDMGVGKTIQALALLTVRAPLGPALVVAPTSVAFNWVREARRFAPGLRPVVYREVDRASALASLGPGDLLITTYGLLARDAEDLAGVTFATLVLDEAQAVKNPATQRARAVASLAADFRLALTGTPVENRLAELWSLFRVVVPGLLGSWDRFRTRFAGPIERDRDPERQAALARLVRPFILRRMKSEVARELPARIEVRQDITLSTPERALYDAARANILADLAAPASTPGEGAGPDRRFQVLAGLLRLRQLACHPRLFDDDSPVPSAKLERCLELVDELREGGHRALIFSQFTSHLALVAQALQAAGVSSLYLDGETPPRRREELVDAFQQGQADVFLISLRAGGTGLNLTAADVVIHLDPWWNPSVEDQATDRAHRIGQERPVTVYRLVTRETVEEAILDLHADKRRLVAGILDGSGSAAAISTEELWALLRAEA